MKVEVVLLQRAEGMAATVAHLEGRREKHWEEEVAEALKGPRQAGVVAVVSSNYVQEHF